MDVRILSNEQDHQVLGVDYCTGYADQFGKWNTGFYCPSKSNDVAVFCCGTSTYKYCCTRREVVQQSNSTRTQLDPRIVLKIVGLTCIVSVFLTILTCYFCKRYWKRSDSRDNHVYRVACSTSNTPHVFPLDSFPLNPNAFFKSENRDDTANFCGDISVISAQPTHYRTRAPRPNPSASALCSYQHHSLSRQQRSHEPPPPYQLSVISETARSAPTNRHAAATATDPKSIEVATTPTTANTSQQSAQQNKQVTADKTDNAETGPKRFVWRRLSH